tara:strand:+ start:160 stop:441 length:282 start_codon:yes stop_codon:yes gene_type:complete
MNFLNKLHETNEILDKLEELILSKSYKDNLKKYLLSISEDLASYKEIDEKNIRFGNDQIKFKITEVLNRINEIETNVKNKLVITEKYKSYLKS